MCVHNINKYADPWVKILGALRALQATAVWGVGALSYAANTFHR